MPKSSVISHARDFIKTKIDNNGWKTGTRLPTTRQIALEIHTDTQIVVQALKILQNEGYISIFPRKGMFVGSSIKNPIYKRRSKEKKIPVSCIWRRTRDLLEHDIYNTVFIDTALPPARALVERYHVCHQTIRKACEALSSDGVLVRKKNKYDIVHHTKTSHRSTVLSISHSWTEKISIYNSFIVNGITALELACSQHNIVLEKTGTDSSNHGKSLDTQLEKKQDYFGYIVWVRGINTSQLHTLIERLAQFNKPVAIIDENSEYVLPQLSTHWPLLKVFSTAGIEAGKKIGRHLLERGHRHCAYISCFHEQEWSRRRLQGVLQIFAGTNTATSLTQLVRDTVTPPETTAIKDQLAFVQRITSEFRQYFPVAQSWAFPQLASFLGGIENWEYLTDSILKRDLFQKALSNPRITAWVCANDSLAIIAKLYLQEMFPNEKQCHIALTGFDDLPVATENDLTSYNFAPTVLIEKALGYIVYPRQEFFRDTTYIESAGLLIERNSTVRREA